MADSSFVASTPIDASELSHYGVRTPTKTELHDMIMEEERIRMSQEYADECTKVADEINGWLRVNERIQYEIVERFGFTSDIEKDMAVNALRRATVDYPDLPKPVYVRNNKARVGDLNVGDMAPSLLVYDMSGKSYELSELFDKTKPTIVIGSSHT